VAVTSSGRTSQPSAGAPGSPRTSCRRLLVALDGLALAEHVPDRDEATTGLFSSVYRLDDLVTAIGLGVALSFVAYVLGMLSQGLLIPPIGRGSR
jgi:hypothetical protein